MIMRLTERPRRSPRCVPDCLAPRGAGGDGPGALSATRRCATSTASEFGRAPSLRLRGKRRRVQRGRDAGGCERTDGAGMRGAASARRDGAGAACGGARATGGSGHAHGAREVFRSCDARVRSSWLWAAHAHARRRARAAGETHRRQHARRSTRLRRALGTPTVPVSADRREDAPAASAETVQVPRIGGRRAGDSAHRSRDRRPNPARRRCRATDARRTGSGPRRPERDGRGIACSRTARGRRRGARETKPPVIATNPAAPRTRRVAPTPSAAARDPRDATARCSCGYAPTNASRRARRWMRQALVDADKPGEAMVAIRGAMPLLHTRDDSVTALFLSRACYDPAVGKDGNAAAHQRGCSILTLIAKATSHPKAGEIRSFETQECK